MCFLESTEQIAVFIRPSSRELAFRRVLTKGFITLFLHSAMSPLSRLRTKPS